MAGGKEAAKASASNDKYAILVAYLRHCKTGKLNLEEAAKDETIKSANKQACYDKLKFILKKEGLTVGGVFDTSATDPKPKASSESGDDGPPAKKAKAPRAKPANGGKAAGKKGAKKRKLDEDEEEKKDEEATESTAQSTAEGTAEPKTDEELVE
ncbi:hypothetical protein BJ508DRAFT_335856 [Ascobolus immersus RN42]|uniref:Uncharacterized protein n=1 Tax=Ascobolus immersus RN42 TaxID=1160509 RepID=A0A3N4HAR6_ASCIM|nr:hypothetical protein BJ508DRAFT_335856 [Ascobolus immersus RN42]